MHDLWLLNETNGASLGLEVVAAEAVNVGNLVNWSGDLQVTLIAVRIPKRSRPAFPCN
jgi:hypothetical protein